MTNIEILVFSVIPSREGFQTPGFRFRGNDATKSMIKQILNLSKNSSQFPPPKKILRNKKVLELRKKQWEKDLG